MKRFENEPWGASAETRFVRSGAEGASGSSRTSRSGDMAGMDFLLAPGVGTAGGAPDGIVLRTGMKSMRMEAR